MLKIFFFCMSHGIPQNQISIKRYHLLISVNLCVFVSLCLKFSTEGQTVPHSLIRFADGELCYFTKVIKFLFFVIYY